MAWTSERACRSEINRARLERNSPPHPRNKEGEEAAHAAALIRQKTTRKEETAASTRKMPIEILFSNRTAPPVAQSSLKGAAVNAASVNGSAGGARVKLDLAERGLVVRHVLLQERHQSFGL